MTPPAAESAKTQLVRNSFLLVGIESGSKLLGLIFFILLARYLGAAELGIYAAAITWANFFVLLPKFGLENLVQREVGRSPEEAWAYWRQLGTLKALLTLVALLGLALALFLAFRPHWVAMLVLGFFVCGYSFLELLNAFFRAIGRAEFEVLSRLCFSLSNLAIGIPVLVYDGRLVMVAMAQGVSVFSAVALALLLLRRLTGRRVGARPRLTYREALRQAAPFAGIVVALFCSNQMGMLILSLTATKEAVGYLAAALRLFDNLTLLPAAIMGAFLPVASQQFRRSLRAFTLTCRATLKYLFIMAAPLAVGLFWMARPLTLFLYKEQFLPVVGVFQILSPALIFSFWNYLGDNMLIARDQERRLFALAWLAAAIHIGANAVLVPWLSYRGAAWAILATQGSYCLILGYLLQRYVAPARVLQLIWRPALSAAGMGLLVWAVQDLPFLLVVILGAMAYFILLRLSGAITPAEMADLKTVCRRLPQPAAAKS